MTAASERAGDGSRAASWSRSDSRTSRAPIAGPPAQLVAMAPDSLASIGGSQPHQNTQPYLVISFCVALVGIVPSRN